MQVEGGQPVVGIAVSTKINARDHRTIDYLLTQIGQAARTVAAMGNIAHSPIAKADKMFENSAEVLRNLGPRRASA